MHSGSFPRKISLLFEGGWDWSRTHEKSHCLDLLFILLTHSFLTKSLAKKNTSFYYLCLLSLSFFLSLFSCLSPRTPMYRWRGLAVCCRCVDGDRVWSRIRSRTRSPSGILFYFLSYSKTDQTRRFCRKSEWNWPYIEIGSLLSRKYNILQST